LSSSAVALAQPVRGDQTPRFLSLPPGKPDRDGDFGDRAVQLAEFAGLNLDPWQKLTLRSMLRTAPGSDQWAAYESLILVPRQNGKSVTLEAFDLAKLFLSDPGANGHMIMHTAHLFPTAMESFRHLTGLIRNTPELWAEVARVSKAHGEEGIELKNGNRLRFAARGVNGAGRGFSPDDVVFDEAYRLPPDAEEALLYAISAKKNPQLVYASSTGMADSDILWALVERGRSGGDPSLMLAEWSADTDLDITVEDLFWVAVRQANPALGYRLEEWKTAAEYRKAVSQKRLEGFGRERLGWWADMQGDSAIPTAKWLQRVDEASAITSAPSFALDVSPKLTHAAIAVAGTRADGDLHGEILLREDEAELDYRPGTDWVLPALKDLATRVPGLSVSIVKGSQAESLAPAIEDAGIEVNRVPLADLVAACGLVFKLVNDGGVWHTGQPELTAAVAATKWRDVGEGGQAWGRKKSTSDIAPMFAFTLAISQAQVVYDPLDNIF
jgi:hypothetical protein